MPQPQVRQAARAGTTPLERFTPTDLAFAWDAERQTFVHRYDRDVQLLVVWSGARHHDAVVRRLLSRDLRVLAEVEVRWSPDEVVTNFERLYGQGLYGTTRKAREVGAGPFLVFVVEDPAPRYGYRQSYSGQVELTNLHVVDVKAAARELAGGNRIHSSNNLREFFHDATLLLGEAGVRAVLAHDGPDPLREAVTHDVVGAGGWRDLAELFGVLRLATEYVVLRDFDRLPGALGDGRELHLLARDRVALAAVANARPLDPAGHGARLGCTVGGEPVVLAVREVGDGDLDARWQDDLLRRREWHAGLVAVPRADDHLFSSLHHAKVRQPASAAPPAVLAERVGLPPALAARIADDDVAASVLDGFLSAHGYGLPQPSEPGVHRDAAFVDRLLLTSVAPTPLAAARAELWRTGRSSRLVRLAARSPLLRGVYRRTRAGARALVGAGRAA